LPTRRPFSRAAAARNVSRIAAKNLPNKRRVRSSSRRARQLSALLPGRSKIPASSAEIVAFDNARAVGLHIQLAFDSAKLWLLDPGEIRRNDFSYHFARSTS
jgi:hypothetical protein